MVINEEGIVEMNKAARILGRKPSKQRTINLLARNWFQVKNSTQIVAIAPIDSSMKFVEGGTGWAVAMAQANDREIHVFNLKDNSWYTWNGTSFVPSNVPVLAKDFAGIGSRQDDGKMTPESVQAIRDVYENTFKPTTQPQAGVEISSYSKGLGAALTNPTEMAKSRGNITQSYPVEFNGKTYKDVETAYQALKDKSEARTKPAKENSKNYKLMVDLIKAKLQQHPGLVTEITKQGGASWISSSTHQPTKQNTVWETGGQNWFIESLTDAYNAVAQPQADNNPLNYNYKIPYEKLVEVIPGSKFGALLTKVDELINDYRINLEILTKTSDSVKQKIKELETSFRKENRLFGDPKFNLEKWESLRQELSETIHAELKKVYPTLPNLEKVQSVSAQPTAPVIVETPKQEGEYEFEFSNGFKVYTPFELNTQQKNALLSLEHFANNPKDFQSTITLSGYAGTGKTTIMSLFTEYLDNTLRSYKLTSPTHRANTVTKSKNPNKSVDTLAKTFGLKPTLNIQTPGTYSTNDLVWDHKKRGKSILQPGDYLIIDESSMVIDDLFKMITDATNDMDLKIIYMGDAGQAEPVQGRSGVSKVFLAGRQIELTQVERTGDNPILYESTRLRTPKEDVSGVSAEKEGKGVLFVNQNNFSEISAILNTEINNLVYGENPLSFRVLAATNSAVQQYNLRSRYSLFQDKASDILHKGEIMMGYGMVLQGDDELVANSVDYKVLNVIDGQSSIDIAYKNNGTVVKEKVNVRGKKVELQNIYTDEVSDMFILDHTVDQENAGKLAYALVYYKNEESDARRRGDKEKRAIMQDKSAEIENSYVFMTNIYVGTNGDYSSGIHLEPINNKKLNQQGMNSAPSIMKTLDYGYAHTIHKSQGGTYNKIMILEDSIDVYEKVKIKYKKEEESIEDIENSIQKLKYVAVSRASDYVYYISTPRTIKSTTSYSKEKQERKPSSPGPSTPSQTNIPVSNAKVTKSGTMSFQYQGFQTADLERMGITNTFDAILAGKRTATTRYVNTSKKTFDYWATTKVGDVIEFWSGKKTGEGKSVKVEVTNIVPVDWTQMSAEDVADWTAKEGWDGYKLWDDHQKKEYKGIQIQFRILSTPAQRKNIEDDNAEDDNNLTCNPF
jgi:exodeoxyribonuclease-5